MSLPDCATGATRRAAPDREWRKHSGFTNVGKRSLKLFGVIAKFGVSVGAAKHFKDDVVTGEALKTFLGEAVDGFIGHCAKKLGADWKPVCFGDWYKDEIAQLIKRSTGNQPDD